MTQTHGGRPNTRFRDIVDLSPIARDRTLLADDLGRALASALVRRGEPPLTELVVPESELWRRGYAGIVSELPGFPDQTLAEAAVVAKRMVDPVLAGRVAGQRWSPEDLAWVPPA